VYTPNEPQAERFTDIFLEVEGGIHSEIENMRRRMNERKMNERNDSTYVGAILPEQAVMRLARWADRSHYKKDCA
jgi:hypothetical protein